MVRSHYNSLQFSIRFGIFLGRKRIWTAMAQLSGNCCWCWPKKPSNASKPSNRSYLENKYFYALF